MEPAPVNAGGNSGKLLSSNQQVMGNNKSKSTLEDIEEVSVSNVTVAVAGGSSILDQLAEDVPWADDDSWQAQSETQIQQDETDKSVAPVDDTSMSTPFVDEDGVHYLHDGHYWLEMPGLPPAEEPSVPLIITNGEPEPRSRNIRVRFSTDPIRGACFVIHFGTCPVSVFFFLSLRHLNSILVPFLTFYSLQHILRQ